MVMDILVRRYVFEPMILNRANGIKDQENEGPNYGHNLVWIGNTYCLSQTVYINKIMLKFIF